MSRHGCGSISLAEHARRIARIHIYIYIYIFYIFKNVSISTYLISNVFILGNEGGCPSKQGTTLSRYPYEENSRGIT